MRRPQGKLRQHPPEVGSGFDVAVVLLASWVVKFSDRVPFFSPSSPRLFIPPRLESPSYTAFIAPVSSARLHSEAKTQSCLPLNANEGPASPPVGMQRAMETPYVVRTHAASQTHDERPCWTYSHPHASSVGPSPSDDVDPTYPAVYDSGSARAADNIDNDRHAYISFQHDPTYGAANGCGYGPLDEDVSSILSSNQTEMSSSGDTTVTIHGFLGSFHSVLYDSPPSKSRGNDNATKTGAKDENRSSAISIAPNSFSVGMFSWFPLVSTSFVHLLYFC